jgi:hypothetical protein
MLALERVTTPGYEVTVATGSPIDMTDPEQLEKLFYSAEDYIGGQMLKVLETSLKDGIAREIRCWNGRIMILPAAGRVFTNLPDMRLRQISIVGFNVREVQAGAAPFEFRVTELPETSGVWVLERDLSATMSSETSEAFTWKVTAWISRGRVPSDTHLTMPVVLIHWPNLTRLLMIPNAMRIAALWADQPRSLMNSARALKIPLSQVLTFYSAAKAIGLITLPKRQVDFLFHPEPVAEHGSRSLFKGILGKLLGTGSA